MRTTNVIKKLTLAYSLLYSMTSFAKMEVHEWGTFTSLVGSDGITQDGMSHEDEPLPDFVHSFGETLPLETAAPPPTTAPTPRPPPCEGFKGRFCRDTFANNVVTQKMETPVIYFYSDTNTKQRVEVNVKFPEGVITETYPAPVESSPSNSANLVIKDGQAKFVVDVLPSFFDKVPQTPAGSIYEHARFTHSNVVHSADNREIEKFIFYRGLGRFQPKISITSHQGSLHFESKSEDKPLAMFLVDVNENGDAQMLKLPMNIKSIGTKMISFVAAEQIADLQNHTGFQKNKLLFGAAVRKSLIEGLFQAGLFNDEAEAMINTWENGYLKVPGLRLLYILPRNEVDEVLPLNISPAPARLVRAFVGRIEVLLDTEEARLTKDIMGRGLSFDINSLGRFAEPKLRRILQIANKSRPEIVPIVQTLIDRTHPSDPTIKTAIH